MKKYKKRLLSGLLAMVMLGTSFPTKIVSATETEEPLEPSIRNITVTVGDLGSVAIKDAEEKFYQAEANTTLSLEVEEGSEIHLDAIPMEGAEVESYKLLDSTGILQEITEAEELNQSSMYGVDITVQDDLEVQFTFKERSGNGVLDESDLENGNSVSDSEKELSETVNSDQTKPEKEEEKDFESDKKIEKSEETNTEIETFPFHAGETMIYEKASKGRTVATSSLSVVESGGPLEFSTLTRPALKYAGSTLNGLNTFHTFLTQVISLVGGFFLLWGIFDFGTSLMGNDGVMQATAFKRIAAGVVCMSAGSIFTLLKG